MMAEVPLPFLEGQQAGPGPAGGFCQSLRPAELTLAPKLPPWHWPWAAVTPGPHSPSQASTALLRPQYHLVLSTNATALALH